MVVTAPLKDRLPGDFERAGYEFGILKPKLVI